MNPNYKKRILQIDTVIQTIFLYWFALGACSIAVYLLFYQVSFLSESSLSFLGYSFYIIIFLLLSLPIFGVWNLIANFFHYKYGSYSDGIRLLRRRYIICVAIFVIFLSIFFVADSTYSYPIIDGGAVFMIALVVGNIFALVHSYITLSENKTRKDREVWERQPNLY